MLRKTARLPGSEIPLRIGGVDDAGDNSRRGRAETLEKAGDADEVRDERFSHGAEAPREEFRS